MLEMLYSDSVMIGLIAGFLIGLGAYWLYVARGGKYIRKIQPERATPGLALVVLGLLIFIGMLALNFTVSGAVFNQWTVGFLLVILVTILCCISFGISQQRQAPRSSPPRRRK